MYVYSFTYRRPFIVGNDVHGFRIKEIVLRYDTLFVVSSFHGFAEMRMSFFADTRSRARKVRACMEIY